MASVLPSTPGQQPGTPPVPNLAPLYGDKRMAPLPRGCRFRDLGEAHRNITGRSFSASDGGHDAVAGRAGAAVLSSPPSASASWAHGTPTSPVSPGAAQAAAETGMGSPEDSVDGMFGLKQGTPTPSGREPARPLPVLLGRSVSPLSNTEEDQQQQQQQQQDRSSGSQFAMTVDSRDTTVRLYRQYQAQGLGTQEHGSSPAPVHWGPRAAANANRPFSTVPTRESLLYPKPLRVLSIRAEEKHTSLPNGIAVSATGMTTDSEDDPFRYDKDPYKIFLHPSKERDVSAALNHISGLSGQSRATLHGHDDGTAAAVPGLSSTLRPPPLPKTDLHGDNDGDDAFFSGPTRARSPTPESAAGFYDTSVIQPNWAVEQSAYEVKVVLQDGNRNTSGTAGHRSSWAGERESRSLYDRIRDKENRMSSERDDWETVATTAAGLGSLRQPAPRRLRGAAITGSSVADVSDDGDSFGDVPFDEYASTDRIVQHPSGLEDSDESLQIRNLSGTRFPVMVPKQRVHRVNGFAPTSSRMFPPSQLSGSEAAAALAKRVSSPFRQLSSARRPRQFSPTPLQPLAYKLEKGKSRFEFRHDSQASDSDAPGAKAVYEFQGVSSDTGRTQPSEANNTTVSGGQSDSHDGAVPPRKSGSSRSSDQTVHSFPFPLIPLPEAARMQAVKRTASMENGDSDGCWAKTAKTPKGHGHLRMPERALYRSPTAVFAAMFSRSSTPSSRGYRRLKKPRTSRKAGARQPAHGASRASTDAGGTWATIAPVGGTGTRYAGPPRMLKTAATRLRLDEFGRTFQQHKTAGGVLNGGPVSGSATPRLYPWDYPMRRRPQFGGSTDAELQTIALEAWDSGGRRHHGSRAAHDLERSGVPLDAEAFLSWDGRRRRRVWFHCMLALCVFPFISVLVYLGKLDSGLSWFTRGEVGRLNARQRRTIFAVMVLQFVLWPTALVLLVWRAQAESSMD